MNNIHCAYDMRELLIKQQNINMTTYLHDKMILTYETLILYILKDIEIIELRRIIWDKIFNFEELELATQTWYEIDEIDIDLERINISDLELEYSD